MKRLKIQQTDHQKAFFFSDPHIGHSNICGGSTNWVKFPTPYDEWTDKKAREEFCLANGVRPFSSLEKMNNTIIDNINETVRQNDILFCLGDWSFGGKENIKMFRDRIVCENIHLVYGNHDEHIHDERYDFHRLFTSTGFYLEVVIDGILVCNSHYKHLVWNSSHRGSYHFYGHSHSNAEHMMIGRSIDVGLDNAYKILGEYRPFSFDELRNILSKRSIHSIDHHNRDTIR